MSERGGRPRREGEGFEGEEREKTVEERGENEIRDTECGNNAWEK